MPEAASGKVTLLFLGASKKGGDRTKEWKERFLADFGSDQNVNYYVVALLEGAPGMFRGMIRNSMRSGTPPGQRSHVVTSNSGVSSWRQYFDLSDDSLPMILLLDRTGHSQWKNKGNFEDQRYRELNAAIAALLKSQQ